ncbi:MAG: glycoside hydrolase family 43 protein [Parafilimonas sp.]|nr:glycoside hydrolase family 43 protein [Parafilimonas sp.]
MLNKSLIAFLFLCLMISCGKNADTSNPNPPPPTDTTTFKNPLLQSGPDPWVAQKDGYYYYTETQGNKISIWKTKKISDLKNASITTVWTPTAGTAYSDDVWAPEIHFVQNKWYIYFAADSAGQDETHRLYVLENSNADPTTGTWTFKGKINEPSNNWAIDADEFEYNGSMYLLWSGWENNLGGKQNIYIAKLSNPFTTEGSRVLISSPTYEWEKNGFPVNEGPEEITNASGNAYITFSASFCGTDKYCLGLLSLKSNGDPLNASDWIKSSSPVFTTNANGGAYGPGHNGFFLSPDGTQNWIIYHANNTSGEGCGDSRNPRIQKFTWNSDGSPNFGNPVAINTAIKKPSGE